MERRILLLLPTLLLAACFPTPKQPPQPESYTLSPLSSSGSVGGTGSAAKRNVTLKVARVEAPGWLNTRDMYYQLLYADQGRISAYSRSRWVAPPPQLLGKLLEDRLSELRAWQAVLGPNSEASADLTVHVQLTEFQQNFKTPNNSYGALKAQATLIENRNRKVLAQRDFTISVPAPEAKAEGGVTALTEASNQFVGALSQWLVGATQKRVAHQADAAGGA